MPRSSTHLTTLLHAIAATIALCLLFATSARSEPLRTSHFLPALLHQITL